MVAVVQWSQCSSGGPRTGAVGRGRGTLADVSSNDEVAIFFSNWQTYRGVIETNSMEHIEVFAAVHSILARRTAPYTLFDLGCGDAAAIGPAMLGTPVQRYVGVDCAAGALDFARETFADRAVPEVSLIVDDLLQAVETTPEHFDIILASFALHHFSDADKQRFLTVARDKLAPGGELILIDVVRLDGQTREEYLDRYRAFSSGWPLPQETRDKIMAHVSGYDYPAEISAEETWARDTGYTVEQFYRGARDTQVGWLLTPR